MLKNCLPGSHEHIVHDNIVRGSSDSNDRIALRKFLVPCHRLDRFFLRPYAPNITESSTVTRSRKAASNYAVAEKCIAYRGSFREAQAASGRRPGIDSSI